MNHSKFRLSFLLVVLIVLFSINKTRAKLSNNNLPQNERFVGTWLLLSATMDGKAIEKGAETLVLKSGSWISKAACVASGNLIVNGNRMRMNVVSHSCPGTSIPSLEQSFAVSPDGGQLVLEATFMGARFRNVYRRISSEQLDWVEPNSGEEFENISDEPESSDPIGEENMEDIEMESVDDELQDLMENPVPNPFDSEQNADNELPSPDELPNPFENENNPVDADDMIDNQGNEGANEDLPSPDELPDPFENDNGASELEDELRDQLENADPNPFEENTDTNTEKSWDAEELPAPDELPDPFDNDNGASELEDELRDQIENADPNPLQEINSVDENKEGAENSRKSDAYGEVLKDVPQGSESQEIMPLTEGAPATEQLDLGDDPLPDMKTENAIGNEENNQNTEGELNEKMEETELPEIKEPANKSQENSEGGGSKK